MGLGEPLEGEGRARKRGKSQRGVEAGFLQGLGGRESTGGEETLSEQGTWVEEQRNTCVCGGGF